MTESSPTAVKSADRAIILIEHIASVRSATFPEIAEALALPRSSAHGLLATLVAAGWLHRNDETKRYSLGLRAWQIGQLYGGHRELAEVAAPIMDELCAELGETVQLARLDGIENVYIAISESSNPMRLASSVGMRLHAHATGIGKVLLGQIDRDEAVRRLRSVTLPRLTDKTVTDVDELMKVIDRSHERGYALDDEEFIEGCRCVAVPVTNERTGGLVSAMSVTMSTARTGDNWPGSVLLPLQAAADRVRRSLGTRD